MKRAALEILVFLLLLAGACPWAGAGVRVEEDEVVFTLTAPGAGSAFLVGDFNNWNPTLEKMYQTDGGFEVRLFLLAGSYRYKYVVDGKWIVDPDNPPSDPRLGSALVLEERAGTLVMAADRPEPGEKAPTVAPSGRYIGAFFVDDGETDSAQSLDFFFDYTNKIMQANVTFKTIEETWELSPVGAEINFNRGYVDLRLGGTTVKGFENDTIWTSHDPYRLVGDVGIFDYSAGYERKGFSLEMPLIFKMELRAMYTDKTELRPAGQVVAPASAFGNFASTAAPDTAVYVNDDTFEDEDSWGVELLIDAGDFDLGYGRRFNRGLHPGLLIDVVRNGSDFDLVTSSTREYWDANAYWLVWRFAKYLRLGAAYGDADAHARRGATSFSTVPALGDQAIGQQTAEAHGDVALQTSRRWDGSLVYENGGLRGTLGYQWNRFEFVPPAFDPSAAEIHVGIFEVTYDDEGWRAGGTLRYTDQDYADTPADFYFLTPARNYWLDYLDKLDIESLPGFDLERYAQLLVYYEWNPQRPFMKGVEPAARPFSLRFHSEVTGRDVFAAIQYVAARAAIEYRRPGGLYAQADARVARYDKDEWGLDETFYDLYVELGYRRSWLELSAGLGFDPIVFNPVLNEFGDFGRQEFLRRSLIGGLRRDEAQALGARLGSLERELEDFGALKLEAVLLF